MGEDTDGSLATRNPKRVLQFNIYNRNYLIFANQGGDKFSISGDTFSYLYKWDLHTSQFKLFQKLYTNAAVDVALVHVPESSPSDPNPNPLNSQWFLIFANSAEDDSLVYKFVGGRFIAFQSISLAAKPISVAAFSRVFDNSSPPHSFQQILVFLTEDFNSEWFQFDGFNFQPIDGGAISVPSSPAVPSALRFLPVADGVNPRLLIEYGNVGQVGQADPVALTFSDPAVDATDELNSFHTRAQAISNYFTEVTEGWDALDVKTMNEKYRLMPKASDSPIILDDVTFSGGFSATNIDVAHEFLKTDEDGIEKIGKSFFTNTNTATGVSVTIDEVLLDDIIKYKTTYENNLESLWQDMDSLQQQVNAGVKLDESSTLSQNVIFKDLKVNGKVEASKLVLAADIRVAGSSDPTAPDYDLVDFMKNTVQLESSGTSLIQFPLSFENIAIENEYSIHSLNSDPVANIWHSNEDKEVDGTTTLTARSSFVGETSVAGTVGGLQFTKNHILLDSEDQTLDTPFTVENAVISSLSTDHINSVALAELDDYLSWNEDEFAATMIANLEVDKLVIPKINLDILDILENDGDQYPVVSEVHMKDLVDKSMKKSQPNDVVLKYDFNGQFTCDNLILPENFISFSGSKTVNGDFIFDNVEVTGSATVIPGGSITSGTITVDDATNAVSISNDETINVDTHGNLELLLKSNLGLSNYDYTVSATKTFPSIVCNENLAFTDSILGIDAATFYSVMDTGEMQGPFTATDLTLTSYDRTVNIDLSGQDTITVGGTTVNLSDYYTHGVRRDIATWPASITSVDFTGKVEFMNNLDVGSLNNWDDDYVAVNPSTDWIPLNGAGDTRVFQAPVNFTDGVTFVSSPALSDPNTAQVISSINIFPLFSTLGCFLKTSLN